MAHVHIEISEEGDLCIEANSCPEERVCHIELTFSLAALSYVISEPVGLGAGTGAFPTFYFLFVIVSFPFLPSFLPSRLGFVPCGLCEPPPGPALKTVN